nr:hypothetical protein [Tanacetum cinerariifolium]
MKLTAHYQMYAMIFREGLYYCFLHPNGLIPYIRFTKIIVDHYMIVNPDIPRRLHVHYHRVKNYKVVKSTLNSGRNKEEEGINSPEWMLTEEMKLTAHYQMYAMIFRVDVPMTK